ncbi:MAG: glycoside hydrolase family 36 N-terminal domain-containing protein, partial [Christensenellales bacterium]
MPITYMPAEGLIHISAADVSYIIHIYRGCYPLHVYYGKRVPEEDVRWYVEAPYRRKKLIENLQPDDPMFLREFFPFEYPTYGTSDFRKPALDLRDAAGSCVTDLRYTGHEIIPGKPALKGMPSLYCETDGEATTMRLDMQDAKSGLKVALYYTVFEKTGLITRRAEIANGGDTPVTLKSALSVSMDFKHAPYEMLQLSGTALREHHIVRRKLECGETSIDSTRGISSHQQNPFIALVQQDTTETQGDAYGL